MPSRPGAAQSRSRARRNEEEEMGVDDTHTPVDPGWTPYDCWVLHAEGDTHALVDPHIPGASHQWYAGQGLSVKGGVGVAHSSAGEWTPPVGLALPQVGDTHAHAQAHSQVTSQLGTMNNENNNSHHKAQWAGAHALTPDSLRLQAAIDSIAKFEIELSLDIMFQGHLVAMLAFLWIYVVDDSIGWHATSLVAATAAGKGTGLACSLCMWTWDYLDDEEQLLVSIYGRHSQSIIQDDDLAEAIHTHLQSLGQKYLHALDIVQYLHKLEVKVWLRLKKMLSECTAQHWMHVM